MGSEKGFFQGLMVALFEHLLGLYPPRFRQEFSDEIHAVFLKQVGEANTQGEMVWFATILQEIMALALSIFTERWHEWLVRKVEKMVSEDQVAENSVGGGVVLQRAGVPGSGLLWVAGWILLTTAVFPVALFLASPLAVPYMWLFNLGAKAGLWPASYSSYLEILGFFSGMALGMAAAQWLMLRHSLLKSGLWFVATSMCIWLAGLGVWWFNQAKVADSLDPNWPAAALLLVTGLALGMAQWLHARHFLHNASWIILIDLLAAASLLLLPGSFTKSSDLVWLVVLTFPGMITGVGMWLLLRRPESEIGLQSPAKTAQQRPWLRRILWIGMVLAALVPLYFVSIYAYAASRIALAMNQGVYPTVEAALIGTYSLGYGGAKVVSVENIQTGPNYRSGQMPFLWFGTATVKLDRIPRGSNRAYFWGGSYFMHTREGWVFMPESSFPEFVGWVMELYHMEGVQ